MDAIIHDFYAHLKQGRIMGRRCRHCGDVAFPPRGLCTSCGGDQADWLELSRRGRLLFVSAGPNLLLEERYVMATVELAEGPVIAGVLREDGFDDAKPETVWDWAGADIPVAVEVATNARGGVIVAFKRLSSQA